MNDEYELGGIFSSIKKAIGKVVHKVVETTNMVNKELGRVFLPDVIDRKIRELEEKIMTSPIAVNVIVCVASYFLTPAVGAMVGNVIANQFIAKVATKGITGALIDEIKLQGQNAQMKKMTEQMIAQLTADIELQTMQLLDSLTPEQQEVFKMTNEQAEQKINSILATGKYDFNGYTKKIKNLLVRQMPQIVLLQLPKFDAAIELEHAEHELNLIEGRYKSTAQYLEESLARLYTVEQTLKAYPSFSKFISSLKAYGLSVDTIRALLFSGRKYTPRERYIALMNEVSPHFVKQMRSEISADAVASGASANLTKHLPNIETLYKDDILFAVGNEDLILETILDPEATRIKRLGSIAAKQNFTYAASALAIAVVLLT